MRKARNIKKGLILALVIIHLIVGNNVLARKYEDVDIKIGSYSYGQLICIESENGLTILDKNKRELYKTNSNKLEISLLNSRDIKVLVDGEEEILELTEKIYLRDLNSSENPITINGNKYRGHIKLIEDNLNLINHIDIDLYLLGVLPREMSPSANEEALKAQALVARSFVYGNIGKHSSEGYDLCNSTHCQVYSGYDVEDNRTNLAVEETAGEYITYNGDFITTPYHSTSGGYTEDSAKVWGGDLPYLKGKEDPYSSHESVSNNWEMELDPVDLKNKLIARGIDIGDIYAIKINETSDSKRVLSMSLLGSKASETMTGNQFRNMMGTTNLKSTMFRIMEGTIEDSVRLVPKINLDYIDRDNKLNRIDPNMSVLDGQGNYSKLDEEIHLYDGKTTRKLKLQQDNPGDFNSTSMGLRIVGSGYGHGVGMSQRGAMEMAKKGFDYEDIVKFYYTGVNIEKN